MTLSEPDKWAQQNPEAWEALRDGRARVYTQAHIFQSADPRKDWLVALCKPFKRDEEKLK